MAVFALAVASGLVAAVAGFALARVFFGLASLSLFTAFERDARGGLVLPSLVAAVSLALAVLALFVAAGLAAVRVRDARVVLLFVSLAFSSVAPSDAAVVLVVLRVVVRFVDEAVLLAAVLLETDFRGARLAFGFAPSASA